jgi:hypothetical protein
VVRRDDVEAMVRQTVDRFGRLDVLGQQRRHHRGRAAPRDG